MQCHVNQNGLKELVNHVHKVGEEVSDESLVLTVGQHDVDSLLEEFLDRVRIFEEEMRLG